MKPDFIMSDEQSPSVPMTSEQSEVSSFHAACYHNVV